MVPHCQIPTPPESRGSFSDEIAQQVVIEGALELRDNQAPETALPRIAPAGFEPMVSLTSIALASP